MRRPFTALATGALALMLATGCSAQTSAPKAAASSAATSSPAGETAADRAFGARVRAYLLNHPEVIQEAVQKLDEQTTAQAAASARAAILQHGAALNHDPRDPVAGALNGSQTLVEFFDYRCPYCKVAAPQLPAFLAAHPNVRLVFKEFPILSETSEVAARYALAAARQGKYLPVHQALMKLPTLDLATIQQVLKENGVDLARAKADADGPAIKRQIEETHALASALGVNGTPAFITGSTLSAGWMPEELDAALKAQPVG